MTSPDRPTREQVEAALLSAEKDAHRRGLGSVLAAEVRALRAELDRVHSALRHESDAHVAERGRLRAELELFAMHPATNTVKRLLEAEDEVSRLRAAGVARTPQPAEQAVITAAREVEAARSGAALDAAAHRTRVALYALDNAPLPAVPDGPVPRYGDQDGPDIEDDEWFRDVAIAMDQAVPDGEDATPAYTDSPEHHEMVVRVGSGHVTAKGAIARLVAHGHDLTDRAALDYTAAELRHRSRQYGRSSDTIGSLRHRVVALEADRRGWIVHQLAQAKVSAPDGEDVPARLDAAAEAIDEHNPYSCAGGNLRGVAESLRLSSPGLRAAVASALSGGSR